MRVLVIGGYGNFGKFISRELVKESNIQIIVAGRSLSKAEILAEEIGAEAVVLDIHKDLASKLQEIKPNIVIHTSGPFQTQGYEVAESCIDNNIHYVDLADGREFVSGISTLNNRAIKKGILVISGASSVPCFTYALIEHYKNTFATLESIDYGISTAQKTTRGLATTAAILSYTGKKFTTLIKGKKRYIFGWQSLRAKKYSWLGWRLLGNCNIPDLDILPKSYPELKTIRFYAGLELPLVHITLWALSWLVRAGFLKSLEPLAPYLLKLSFIFDRFGSSDSGFHMDLAGKDTDGSNKTIRFELTARSGDGPYIPCIPAILIAKKLANGEITYAGAKPCIGIITRDEYLSELADLDIHWDEKSISA